MGHLARMNINMRRLSWKLLCCMHHVLLSPIDMNRYTRVSADLSSSFRIHDERLLLPRTPRSRQGLQLSIAQDDATLPEIETVGEAQRREVKDRLMVRYSLM